MSAVPARLQAFVACVEQAVEADAGEPRLLADVERAMHALVAADDWLAPRFATPHPQYYQQYLLHRDPRDRFSVVSFVWGPGQATPIHDHTTWGVIGMLRGAERCQGFRLDAHGLAPDGACERLEPGDVACVSPAVGDIHQVRNAYDDRVSVSIHVYGTDIGRRRRHVFDPATGAARDFVSGYAQGGMGL
jgi:3-mercaptopropionate dioxygenase